MEVGLVNFKKLFPDKKVSEKRILDFFDKKGFYIVLGLCITIIGITAALVTSRNISSSRNIDNNEIISSEMASNISTEDDKTIANFNQKQSDIESEAKAAAKPLAQTGKPSSEAATPKPATDDKKTGEQKEKQGQQEDKNLKKPSESDGKKDQAGSEGKTEKKPKSEPSGTGKLQSFTRPVFGEITYEFAYDKLVYSKTLDEWRTHSGVDIKADRGTPVKAACDGVVADVKNDPRFGIMVFIEHANGIKTVYGNLASADMVTTNQKVKQGEVIGSVGNTAKIEAAEPPHLHFEVLKDNKPVDPGSYLPDAVN